MDYSDSSSNYTRVTSSFDAKKDKSPQEESECDETVSDASSTVGSSPINEIKNTTNNKNKKTMKNFGSIKSFRKRASKSRLNKFSNPNSLFDSSDSSSSSPNYLKSTSSSNCKKTHFQTNPEKSSSPKAKPSSQTRTSTSTGLRNVRVLVKNTSFKPKRSSPLSVRSNASEDVSVDRATYSSTLKDSKVKEEIHPEKTESKEASEVKVCRYHHCSLHGNCQENHDDTVPPLRQFVHEKRQSMNKQTSSSTIPKTESSGKKKTIQKSQTGPTVGQLSRTKNEPKQKEQILGDGYDVTQKSGLTEVAFGENSLTQRNYSSQEQELVGTSSGLKGYCLRCSCLILNGDNNDISRTGNQESSKDNPKTPVKDDEVINKKKGVFSYSQTSSDNNSEEERESLAESNPVEVSKVNKEVVELVKEYSEKDSPNQERGNKLQFSKPRHISMWHLIHEHMSNSPENKSSEITDSCKDLSDSNVILTKNDSEIQEIEVRKLFAINLVREAIEKILLPEIQDQSSDDMSITSEDTPKSEPTEEHQSKDCTEENSAECDADKGEGNMLSNPKDKSLITDDARKTEKKAPKHWSNLKKWILLQRFIKALEKVKSFNPKKPNILPINPDPESEKVNLRPQTVDQRKNSEEWMLDYAIRQAVNELAPTQKRKVALLVKAFETVVPSQDDQSLAQSRIPKLKESFSEGENKRNNEYIKSEEPYSITRSLILDDDGKSLGNVNTIVSNEIRGDDEREREAKPTVEGIQEDERERVSSPTIEDLQKDALITDKKSQIKMWHMIYRHVVSGIAEKMGSQLLEGSEDDDVAEEKLSPAAAARDMRNGFTKLDALKLVKDAVDEILLPEASSEDSSTSESMSEQDVSEKTTKEEVVQKPKNWSKLKKLMLIKRSLRALEKGRIVKPQPSHHHHHHHGTVDIEREKIDLRNQMMEERKKAEEWMIDYAVRNMVTKLTPARKRRVSMLVEAFEAVVPLPEL